MTLAVAGVRDWADAVWRKTRDVLSTEMMSRWPARVMSTLPRLNLRPDWQAVLAQAMASSDTAAAEPPGRSRRHTGLERATAEAARRQRVSAREGTSVARDAGHRREASELQGRHPPPQPPPSSGPDESGTAGWIRPRERARRRQATESVPAVVVDAPALATVLSAYAGARDFPAEGPARRRPIPTTEVGAHHDVRLPNASREWPYQSAWRAARRLTDLPRRTSGHAWNPTTVEKEIAVALVQTLDTSVDGIRLEAVTLPGASAWSDPNPAVGSEPRRPVLPESREPARSSRGARPAHLARHASVRRGGLVADRVAAPAEALGDEVPAEPLQPLGLASTASAPAPDVPISVMSTPAGSVSRVAPPTGAPSFPPLIPAAVTQPPAFGISAPSLRHATRPEDADIDDDDVAGLADRIRRILRDEARRHGITLQ